MALKTKVLIAWLIGWNALFLLAKYLNDDEADLKNVYAFITILLTLITNAALCLSVSFSQDFRQRLLNVERSHLYDNNLFLFVGLLSLLMTGILVFVWLGKL